MSRFVMQLLFNPGLWSWS